VVRIILGVGPLPTWDAVGPRSMAEIVLVPAQSRTQVRHVEISFRIQFVVDFDWVHAVEFLPL